MPKKSKLKKTSTAGFISRSRIIITTALVVVLGAGFTAYAVSNYLPKQAIITDVPTVQTTDSDKVSGTTTVTTTSSATTTTTNPSSSPTTPITPGSSSEVPSLTPTGTQSNSTTTYQATNWSGYLSTGGDFTSVSGSWIAPSPSSTSATVESGDGTWIGIGGVTTSDLIQVGTENTVSPSGIVSTSGFYELLPAGAVSMTSLIVTPGDAMSASITQTLANIWVITLTDVTTGQTYSVSVNYASSLTTAEWIQEDPSYADGSLVLLDNFGTVTFTNAAVTMNGATLSLATNNASQIFMVGQGGATGHGGTPSPINGSSFTVSYY